MYHNEKTDPLSAHLFAIDGEKWRNMRVKLTPTFTSGKMKTMFDSLVRCVQYMETALVQACSVGEEVEMKEYVSRFTTDVIGTCAFGIDCNSFKDPDAEFRMMGKRLFKPELVYSLKLLMVQIMPSLCKSLGECRLLRREQQCQKTASKRREVFAVIDRTNFE